MKSVAYWLPPDASLARTTLVYVISHDSREAADQNWGEFTADPEVKDVMSRSEENGKIVTEVERVFMEPTRLFAVVVGGAAGLDCPRCGGGWEPLGGSGPSGTRPRRQIA